MKKLYLFTFLLFAIISSAQITVGTGTVTQRFPLSSWYGFSRSAALYSSAEIQGSGSISKLAYDVSAASAVSRPIKIYLKTTTSTTLTTSNGPTLIAGATQVYDSSNALTAGWNEFTLSSSFAYTNDNLMVLVETNFGGGGSSETSTSTAVRYTTTSNTHLSLEVDTTAPTTANLTLGNSRPNLRIFGLTPATCIRPATITNSAATAFGATLTWAASTSTPADGYEYEVRSSGAAGSGATGLGTSGTTAAGVLTVNATGLTPLTTYTSYVRSNCGSGDYSSWLNSSTFTTLSACPGTPSAITRTAITNTTATIGWTAPATPPSDGYQYEIRTSGAAGSGATGLTTTANVAAGVLTANLTGLTPLTAYSVYVRTYCGGTFYGSWTSAATFTTLSDCPGTATAVTASAITLNSATISWTASSPVPTNGYQYEIRTSGAAGSGTTGLTYTNTVAAGVLTDNLTGLSTATTYSVYVRNYCGGSFYGTWTTATNFSTLCNTSSTPYTQDFESAVLPALPACTTNQNVGTGNNWTAASPANYGFTSKALRYQWNNSNAANTWFYTNGISLIAGKTYRISYKYGGASTSFTEKLKVAYGTSPVNTAMTTILADHPSIAVATPLNSVVDFSPTADGVYYFGFNAYSAANQFYLLVDDISIAEAVTWNGTAWSNTVGPDATLDAIIAGAYNTAANGAISANKLTIATGGSLTVNSGTNVTLANGLVNTLAATAVVVENNANILQTTGTTNTNLGAITVKRTTNSLMLLDYVMWGSPVANQQLQAFSPSTLSTRFYSYNTATNAYSSETATSNFTNAKGYLIRLPNDHPTTPTTWTGSFVGVPNSGNYTFTPAVGFNAVANPYPSTLSMASFVTDNPTITGTLYFWRKTNSLTILPGYCSWNNGTYVSNGQPGAISDAAGNDMLQVGQGFIVNATATTGILFRNTQRTADTAGQTYRSASTETTSSPVTTDEKHRIWLNLTSTNGSFSQTAFGYMSNATNYLDQYDGLSFNDGNVSLTSLIADQKHVIQGKALPFATTDLVPLNYKVDQAGNFTIAIDNVDGLFSNNGQAIYLRDALLNTETNLTTTSYTFASAQGEFNNRFTIAYMPNQALVNDEFTENSVVIYKNDNKIVVNSGNATMQSVKVFDLTGRLLVDKKDINATSTTLSVNAENQVILVQVKDINGSVVSKKVIN